MKLLKKKQEKLNKFKKKLEEEVKMNKFRKSLNHHKDMRDQIQNQ